jgi:hypothetical protein
MATIDDLIQDFKAATGKDRKIPFKVGQMAQAIKSSAEEGETRKFEDLVTSLASAYVNSNPNQQELMLRNAYETLAALAYLADHGTEGGEYLPHISGPPKIGSAYRDKEDGPAMGMMRGAFASRGIDIETTLRRCA